jgi:hypothetical protein
MVDGGLGLSLIAFVRSRDIAATSADAIPASSSLPALSHQFDRETDLRLSIRSRKCRD